MDGFEFTIDGRRYRIGARTSLKWVDRQRAAVLVARAARSHWSIHGRLADWFRFERRLFAAGYDMSDPAVIDRLIHTIESDLTQAHLRRAHRARQSRLSPAHD
jgi:hypothetical protein